MRLADCCSIVSGGTPKSSEASYWNGDILWVTPKDLTELESKYISSTPRTITESGYAKSSANMLPAQSVLFSSRAPIGHVAINTVPMCTNQGFKSLVPDRGQIIPDYLYHWLRANKAQLQALGNGATFKEVSKTVISRVEIPLPPLEEQRRIAAILDKADALRAKRREAIAKLDQLLQSVFLEMFGDPVTNPKGWGTRSLPEIADFLTGFAFTSKDYVRPGSGVRLCRGANILPDRLDWNDAVDWPAHKVADFERYRLQAGDVVVAMDRPWISSGFKIVLVSEDDPEALLVQRVARLRVRDAYPATFLYQLLRSPAFTRHCKPTETLVPHISPRDFASFPAINPPEGLLIKFDSVARSIAKMRLRYLSSDKLAEAEFRSLQQRAFSGRL
ncbi:restriction modification system DNA specificity subunit [Salinisphaera hydrothermalis EPR70]